MAEFERPPQPASMGMPKPKHEYKPAYTPPIRKQESPEATPEENTLKRILNSTATFIGDLGNANKVASKTLNENATSRVGKGLVVTTAGATLEAVSSLLVGIALETVLPRIDYSKLGNTKSKHQDRLLALLNNGSVQEAITDASVYGAYSAGNKLLDGSLPKVPVSFLGWALGVDLAEFALRRMVKVPKTPSWDATSIPTWEKDDKGNILETGRYIYVKQIEASTNPPTPQEVKFNNSSLAKLLNFSNPVTLFGASQITEGVSEYWKALKETRRARAEGGQQGVERLLVGTAKAKQYEQKKEKQLERVIKAALADENGGRH